MTITTQILAGSFILIFCSLLHICILVWSSKLLKALGAHFQNTTLWFVIFATAFFSILFGHTLQVWIWALSFLFLDAFTGLEAAMYFTIVTYTTLGYGDLVLEQKFRIFASMSAITGLLNFGLSTAFLVAIMNRLFKEKETHNNKGET